MTTSLVTLKLKWWPVGQGLFASGQLESSTGREFSWVYDCGSTSTKSLLNGAINEYRSLNVCRRVDLVTISHFDIDHIKGIAELIRGTRIEILLLPYIPLWQRLLIVISERIGLRNPLIEFFIDPAAYLAGIEGVSIKDIVFVPPAGPDDIVPGADGAPDPDRPTELPQIEYGDPPIEFNEELGSKGAALVRFLRPAGRIFIPSLWEFVPYNDAKMQPLASPAFQKRASLVARNFVTHPKRRVAAIKVLKRLYDRTFGATSIPRNLVSLFLYSGPVGHRMRPCLFVSTHPLSLSNSADNFAQLHTGDGYLDTHHRLSALQRFYSLGRRLERAGILQVMHHGAKGNWHRGVAAALKPAASIFSSDPRNRQFRHPHADVLQDFSTWCPVQVDRSDSFHLLGILFIS